MDKLRSHLENKRKLDHNGDYGVHKYLKKSEFDQLEQPQQPQQQQQKQQPHQPQTPLRQSPQPQHPPDTLPKDPLTSNEDCIKRLRLKSQPIRLFAESDKERRLRLRAIELLSTESSSKGQQNDLHKALEGVGQAELGQLDTGQSVLSGESAHPTHTYKPYTDDELRITWQMVKVHHDKLYATIYKWLKNMLRLWDAELQQRPEDIRRSKQGQLTTANQVQTAGYLKPLFKLLKTKTIQLDVLCLLGEILLYAQERKYQNANDAYLRLSIGNAPWPIGVTMVGIHDRSAREKISSGSVAHVLNDEVSRKYIQSVKRVLTFAQSRYPPEDLSQMVG
ncbi:hypothetical protein E3P86_01906 [Wallemia ichthyophaga]|uniref:Pre-mRNA-splicing factor 18 n=1 Tax=Wallemia ichthyophaga TaxID=245174 RepID=A0A4T0J6D7_WALIC|nr:hypothetical protein E3P86_01906 [Wallemia ichthyophaga]